MDQIHPTLRGLGEKVTVKVGQGTKEETFKIHKNILCYYSRYFEAAFNGPFQEGHAQQAHLNNVEPETFTTFAHLLNSHLLENTQHIEGKFIFKIIDKLTGNTDIKRMGFLIDLWLLGDMLLAPKFQNEVIRTFNKQRREQNGYPKAEFYNRAYGGTLEGNPLRRYIIVLAASDEPREQWLAEVNGDALADMILWMRENKERKTRGWVNFSEEELRQFYVDEENIKPAVCHVEVQTYM